MFDIRKIAVIFVIAILFSIFTFTTIDAIYPNPDYDDFCDIKPKLIETKEACESDGGQWEYYDKAIAIKESQYQCDKISESNGQLTLNCQILTKDRGYCDIKHTCQKDYDDAQEKQKLFVFILAAIFGIIGIVYGIYANPKDNIKQWIGSGFMIGGLINIFFGTMVYFQYTDRFVRPLIIFIELALVIFISIKQLGKK